MKAKTLLILFILCLGFGFYLYYGIQKPAELKEENVDKEGQLAEGKMSELKTLHLSFSNGKPEIDLERESLGWKITAPLKDIASQTKIEGLISALEKFRKTKVILSKDEVAKKKSELAQFGLEKPALRIEYKTTDLSQSRILLVGDSNPSKSAIYAEVGDGGDVVLATMELDTFKTQSPEDFREMRLTTVNGSDFSDLSIQAKGKTSKFSRDAKGDWTMTSPYSNLPLDKELVHGEVDKIGFIRANQFLATGPLPKALQKPDIDIIAGFKEGISDLRTSASDGRPKGVEILIGRSLKKDATAKDEGDRYDYFAKSDKTEPAAIARFHYDNFNREPEDYIKKTFDDFLLSDVEKASFIDGASTVVVTKNSNAITASDAKETKPVSQEEFESIFKALRSMKASKFAGLSVKPPPANAFTIELSLKDKKSRIFRFDFQKDGAYLWFVNGDLKMEYQMPKDPVRKTDFNFESLTKIKPSPKAGDKTNANAVDLLNLHPSVKQPTK